VEIRAAEGTGGEAAGPPSWRLLGVLRADAMGVAGQGLEKVRFVTSGPLAAALAPHDEAAEVRASVAEHASLVEGLHARTAILPARYGTLVRRPEDVAGALLDPNLDALEGLLADVDGRDEIRVRVHQVEQAALEEVAATDPGVAELAEAVREHRDGAPAGLRLELGERIAVALTALAEADAALVLDTLRPLAVAIRGEAPASGAMILDASFLVDRARADAFDQAVGGLIERLGPRAEVRAVGPLPPYRFAEPAVPEGEAA
jgi:Gas vesicle synthesis protein GvpL/GvpF